ncbi:MAG TPA: hypothetical protein VEC99_00120 [Clostridia bacterium]|nr:hypothetical protein [Clostridia bacterium]
MVTVENAETIIAAPGYEIYASKGKGWIPVVGFAGKVERVHEGRADVKQEAKTLRFPVRLRIKGFTMRGSPPDATTETHKPTATTH